MNIIVSAKVWLQVETYNGMWRYFQERMGGDNHEDAWYLTKGEMGYVPEKEKDIKTHFTLPEHLAGYMLDGVEIIEAGWFARDQLPLMPPQGSISRSLIDSWLQGGGA